VNFVRPHSSASFDRTDPAAVRRAIRDGLFRDFTNMVAPGFVQGNLVVVPAAFAQDFEEYCRLNSQALPIVGRSRVGSPHIPELASDLDLRTDVGGYMVFRDGALTGTPSDIADIWRDDLVAFVLGCSFSFEAVLQNHGITLRHLDEGNVSAMYVTNLETVAAGPFRGPLVVSMRALRPADAIAASNICDRYPQFHGRPIAIGSPRLIGIDDLSNSYGGHGLTTLRDDEIPVFWPCGATAQLAALEAKLPLLITHYKAHMVLTDLPIPGPQAEDRT
jgi:uncharacterized protein YcsI (UPF0317 family)